MTLPDTSWVAVSALLFFFLVKYAATRLWRPSLPPGPKGSAIVGNLFQMPVKDPWKVYAQWGETWGKACIAFQGVLCYTNNFTQVISFI